MLNNQRVYIGARFFVCSTLQLKLGPPNDPQISPVLPTGSTKRREEDTTGYTHNRRSYTSLTRPRYIRMSRMSRKNFTTWPG